MTNTNFFSDRYESDLAAEGLLKITRNRVSFDSGITKMFAAIGARAVRIAHDNYDMEIMPAGTSEEGAAQLHFEGKASFVEANVGPWDGFEFSAAFYPEDPGLGLTVHYVGDQIQHNRENLMRDALAA